MPRDRIVIDGLWHCLCPSVDVASLSKPLRLWHVSRARSNAPFAGRSTWSRYSQQQCRRQYTHATVLPTAASQRNEGAEKSRRDYLKRLANRSPWTPGAIFEGLDSFSVKLDNVPTRAIYAILKELQDAEDTYYAITRLVEYLIKERGEKPNTALYESLIKANVDRQHGSARVAGQLLKEVQSHNIPTTPELYQALLKVRHPADI